MKCDSCGAESRDGAVFCAVCGKRFDSEAAMPGVTEPVINTAQPPNESTITDQSQIPDLPASPVINQPQQTAQPDPVQYIHPQQNVPEQQYQQPMQPSQYQPTMQPQQYQQPMQPSQQYPQQYIPAQQYQPQQYQPQQYAQPFGPKKKTKPALLIGIITGSIILVTAVIFAGMALGNRFNTGIGDLEDFLHNLENPVTEQTSGILATPPPVPPSPPEPIHPPALPVPGPEPLPPAANLYDHDFEGMWEYESGDWIWFFGLSDLVMIFHYYEDTFGLYASEPEEWVTCYFTEDGMLIVETDDGYIYEFNWEVNEDRLTIIDVDGDMLHFIRFA